MNNVALGFTLLLAGLAVFVSALNKTTASMIAGLIYGEGGLKSPGPKTEDKPLTPGQAADAWKKLPEGWNRAGVVPVSPKGGIPGLTIPIIPADKMG